MSARRSQPKGLSPSGLLALLGLLTTLALSLFDFLATGFISKPPTRKAVSF
jgi:hypothetical protein